MAHFAEIDENNVVLRVVVVDDRANENLNHEEDESFGRAWCEGFFGGGAWLQTSYNANLRKNFAGVGYTYDSERDAFIAPKPYPSWALNEETCQWEAPAPMPEEGGPYVWNESEGEWQAQS